MPKVYIIGELVKATGYGDASVLAEWRIKAGEKKWKCVNGAVKGSTWTAERNLDDEPAVWNHPFQVEFECSGLHGWPKLMVEVNSVDEHDRIDLCGYGFCHLPMAPGKHTVKIATTRPKGGFWNDLSARLVGGVPRYSDPSSVVAGTASRAGHTVVTTGTVTVQVSVVLQGFGALGIAT